MCQLSIARGEWTSGETGGSGRRVGVLYFGAVGGGFPGMGGILWARRLRLLELV